VSTPLDTTLQPFDAIYIGVDKDGKPMKQAPMTNAEHRAYPEKLGRKDLADHLDNLISQRVHCDESHHDI